MVAIGVALVIVGAALLVAEAHVPAGVLGVFGGLALAGGAALAIGAAGAGVVIADAAASAGALPRAGTAAVATTVDPAPSRHARRDVAVGLRCSECGVLPLWLELLASGVSRMASLLH